jgi:hypothetical protein
MPYLVSSPFFCEELNREVQAGDTVHLTPKQARKYVGKIRATTQRKASLSRS